MGRGRETGCEDLEFSTVRPRRSLSPMGGFRGERQNLFRTPTIKRKFAGEKTLNIKKKHKGGGEKRGKTCNRLKRKEGGEFRQEGDHPYQKKNSEKGRTPTENKNEGASLRNSIERGGAPTRVGRPRKSPAAPPARSKK